VKLSITDVEPLLAEYLSKPGNGLGGHYYTVLSNGNVQNKTVLACFHAACADNDKMGMMLGWHLLMLTKTQRRRISRVLRRN